MSLTVNVNVSHTHIILMLTVLTGSYFQSNLIFNVYTPQNFSVITHVLALEFGHVYRSDLVIFFGHLIYQKNQNQKKNTFAQIFEFLLWHFVPTWPLVEWPL